MAAPLPVHVITTFRDALGFSFELAHRHRRGLVAALTGPDGRIVHLTLRLPEPATATATAPAETTAEGSGLLNLVATGSGGLVVVSLTPAPAPFSTDERGLYLRARAGLSRRQIELLDWIRTDGDLYRSAAHLIHPDTAWPHDPPAERRAERRHQAEDGPCGC